MESRRIVFFDGVCNLCNRFINWLVRWDKKNQLLFAALQGETAKSQKTIKDLTAGNSTSDSRETEIGSTIIYLRNGETFQRSTAVVMILVDLGAWWKLAILGLLIPTPLRDRIYDAVAINRYRIFGRRETCRVPTPEEKSRFLP